MSSFVANCSLVKKVAKTPRKVTAPYLIAKAALDLLALYEGLDISPELSDNLKGCQIQCHFGSSLSRQLDRSL